MEILEDIESWAARERLPAGVSTVLQEDGFSTVDDLRHLTPEIIKEEFQDSGKLKLAQCLALRKAMGALTQTPNTAPAQHAPSPFSPPPPQHTSSWTMTPQSSASLPYSYPAQTYPYPPQSHPYPYPPQSHPYPHPPQSYPSPHQSYSFSPAPELQPAQMQIMSAQPQACGHSAPYGAQSAEEVVPGMNGTSLGVTATMESASSGSAECFRFLLLGKTGSGKSTTGNTIFGESLFNTAACFSSVTSDCERKTNTRNGRKIEIIDSPGLYDTHKSQEDISLLIVQAVAGMHPGPHAILYVVRLGRYTAEEHGAYERLKSLFDESVSRHLIVVFTFGDMLEREQKSVSDLIRSDTPQTLQQVLRECNNRYIVFNNMAANPQPQVEQLLQMVRGLVTENGGQPYSCPKYCLIGEGMEEEVARRLQEVEKRDLQRQKYVQQLEQQTMEAENEARRTKEKFQKSEEERQRRMEAEEERRQQLEKQLQTQIREQQVKFEQHQQELRRLNREREEQELMMKEKEAEMTEKERKRAEEEAERMRQREQEMQAMMEKQEERLLRQRQEDEERRQQMEREKQEFLMQIEEQRKKDREELEKREEEREKLREKQREEEREAAKRRDENYEKEMEKLKSQVTTKKVMDFITQAVSTIVDVIRFSVMCKREDDFSRVPVRERGEQDDPLFRRDLPPLTGASGGAGMGSRNLFGVYDDDDVDK